MSRMPQGWKPRWSEIAHRFYGDAFGPHHSADLSASMDEWAHLTAEEQSFTLAHLFYLGLEAELTTQRMLRRTCSLLERMGGSMDEFLDRLEEFEETEEPIHETDEVDEAHPIEDSQTPEAEPEAEEETPKKS